MAYQYETVKLDKGMYSESGRSFTQVLEKCDPSEQYRGTALEHLDAFQRQLKRFGIKVKGTDSDVVAKFFATWESAVLFPEYVARAVHQGMEESDILPRMVATETQIQGMDYRSIASTPTEEEKSLMTVAEGTAIPETRVHTQENLVTLHKRGRMLVASYEAIQFQRLDLFSVTLRQIGAYISRMHVADAIGVLQNGDGNKNAAPVYTVGTAPIGGTAGSLSYDALVDFWSQFDPYTMNTLVVGDAVADLLQLQQMQDGTAGLTFHGTGSLVTPMGAEVLRSSAVPSGTILGLDRNYALEMVRASDVLVEYDKLIDRQLERAAITSIAGFAKIFTEASKVLKIGTAPAQGDS
ncbi:phage major capsid protein [Evtepia sp.]